MKLKKWKEGVNYCVENAIRMRDDGEILMKNGSYGHAYFSFYTAMEELGVALYILKHFNKPNPKKVYKFLMSHERKRTLMTFDFFSEKIQDLEIPKDYLKDVYLSGEEFEIWMGKKLNKQLEIWDKRNRGIYVSLKKGFSDWITPKEITIEDLTFFKEKLDKTLESWERSLDFLNRRKIL